jgi:hypothetical protein
LVSLPKVDLDGYLMVSYWGLYPTSQKGEIKVGDEVDGGHGKKGIIW